MALSVIQACRSLALSPGCCPSASSICCVWTSRWRRRRNGTRRSLTSRTWIRSRPRSAPRRRSAGVTGSTRSNARPEACWRCPPRRRTDTRAIPTADSRRADTARGSRSSARETARTETNPKRRGEKRVSCGSYLTWDPPTPTRPSPWPDPGEALDQCIMCGYDTL